MLSTEEQNLLKQRIESVEAWIPELSTWLRQMQVGELGVKTKANELDLVTIADVESEKRIVGFLQSKFPEDGILAEEGDRSAGTSGFTWVIDPIDGTINYSHGLPLFAVSIGISKGNVPVAGLILLPVFGWVYKAVQGLGASKVEWGLNGDQPSTRQIQVSSTSEFGKSLIVTGFPASRRSILPRLLKGVENILTHARGVRRTGSAAVDLCWTAEGRFDGQYEISLNPWDTCAGVILVREAGGTVTDLSGNEYTLDLPSLVASNTKIHKDLLQSASPLL